MLVRTHVQRGLVVGSWAIHCAYNALVGSCDVYHTISCIFLIGWIVSWHGIFGDMVYKQIKTL